METKKCCRCGATKTPEMFYKDKGTPDGLQRRCKACCADMYRERRAYQLKWQSDYREKNPERVRQSKKNYYEANKPRILKGVAFYRKQRDREDAAFRLRNRLANRLFYALRLQKAKKSGRTEQMLGCSVAQLMRHLERQFSETMSWANYGSYWHVDHIRPCAAFDHNDPEQAKACWHWSNLRPLEAKANLLKSKSPPTEEDLARAEHYRQETLLANFGI